MECLVGALVIGGPFLAFFIAILLMIGGLGSGEGRDRISTTPDEITPFDQFLGAIIGLVFLAVAIFIPPEEAVFGDLPLIAGWILKIAWFILGAFLLWSVCQSFREKKNSPLK